MLVLRDEDTNWMVLSKVSVKSSEENLSKENEIKV